MMIVCIDSFATWWLYTHHGIGELNPINNWVMETFHLTLGEAMVFRIVYCAPLVYFIYRMGFAGLTLCLYLILYAVLSISQFVI
jgi:hypothetical protein